MINRCDCTPPLPATPFSFSILVDSPIRRNLPFCPVSAMIFPLAATEIHFASMIFVGLNVLMAFLFGNGNGSANASENATKHNGRKGGIAYAAADSTL